MGVNEEDKETALFKDFKSLQTIFNTAKSTYQMAENTLAAQLNNKAIGRQTGIKLTGIIL